MNFHPFAEVFPLIDDAESPLAIKEGRASPAPWLSKGQCATLAAEISEIGRDEMAIRSVRKEKWIRKARAEFDPGPQQDCCICGLYSSVTHAHHIFPLWMQFDFGIIEANNDFAWLCPTHHAGAHLFLKKGTAWPNTRGFTAEEQEALIRIALPAVSWNPEISHAA